MQGSEAKMILGREINTSYLLKEYHNKEVDLHALMEQTHKPSNAYTINESSVGKILWYHAYEKLYEELHSFYDKVKTLEGLKLLPFCTSSLFRTISGINKIEER
jgi:DNA integrity scanning protein DisA with diadenylate cyclase activity